jgi:hypothetical protein
MTLERREKILSRLIKYNELLKKVNHYIDHNQSMALVEDHSGTRNDFLKIVQYWQNVYRFIEKRYQDNLEKL